MPEPYTRRDYLSRSSLANPRKNSARRRYRNFPMFCPRFPGQVTIEIKLPICFVFGVIYLRSGNRLTIHQQPVPAISDFKKSEESLLSVRHLNIGKIEPAEYATRSTNKSCRALHRSYIIREHTPCNAQFSTPCSRKYSSSVRAAARISGGRSSRRCGSKVIELVPVRDLGLRPV